MAKRIPVVLSQTPSSDPNRRELEGDLVTQLLMEDGIEVTLVPHLRSFRPGDTGILCLEGIPGDLILLSWLDSSEAHELLEAHGISGRVGRTRIGADIAGDRGDHHRTRTIYHLDLRQFGLPSAYRDEIIRIRGETSVQVTEIGMAFGVETSKGHVVPLPLQGTGAPDSSGKPTGSLPRKSERANDRGVDNREYSSEKGAQSGDPLDALIDRLDELEL